MKKENVFHFIFCEDRINPEDKIEPFVYEMLQTNIPSLFVTDIPSFSIFLDKFEKNQLVTVWVHHQANHLKTDEYGRYMGENIGAKLISRFPNLKFKYITRAPENPAKSNDKNKNPIILLNDIYEEIRNRDNYQKILDFNINEPQIENKMIKKNKSTNQPNIKIGDNFSGVLNVGSENKISNEVKIKHNNEYLSSELKKVNVSQEDIEELMQIIKLDKPDLEKKKFGRKTNKWIQKMVGKSLDGSWQVTIGASAGILTELLKGFFGM